MSVTNTLNPAAQPLVSRRATAGAPSSALTPLAQPAGLPRALDVELRHAPVRCDLAGHVLRPGFGKATARPPGSRPDDDPAGDPARRLRAEGLGCLRERVHRADLGTQLPLVDQAGELGQLSTAGHSWIKTIVVTSSRPRPAAHRP